MRNLTSVRVVGLLHTFNHHIEFPGDWEFVIVHGPNGIGKTKLFELIKYTFNGDLARLQEIPFEVAGFAFSDGSRLSIGKHRPATKSAARRTKVARLRREVMSGATGNRIFFHLQRPGHEPLEWSQSADANRHMALDLHDLVSRITPARRITVDTWRDVNDHELLSFADVLEKYGDILPPNVRERNQLPAPLLSFINDVNVHLIETQRLLYIPERGKRTRGEAGNQSRVSYLAADLVRRMREVLARSSQTSQELDRTFPRRVLLPDSTPAKEIANELIVRRYNEQAGLRDRLASIDLLDMSGDFPLPNEKLSSWERRVLWTYLQDSEAKLKAFEDILQRVELFRDIVNSRFLFKRIKIDRERGFVFKTQAGEELSPDHLSSGEQHELVLVYGLLFGVEPGSLVLIDEPEISLHPAWQRKFLDDIVRIANLTALRFMIATHSPQIIHKWWGRAVALAPEQHETDERDGQ
ncbi:AAA family ATPase [Micromonospora chalcea]|uniref:AAA family ATPase n=1 Tax=Micromonospora chalcea TaxID=1874 RepID=UPI00165718FF|nr:AAA family ATPase [Micromonospora chalcea]MBC8991468.1 AAA family ATPase [Micromonospora chalcea]